MTTGDSEASGSSEVAKKETLVGRVFNDKFTVSALIARGGMGAVYRAEQAPLGRLCALKVLKPQLEEEARFEFQRRFFLEASFASKLTHPNTVTIFDYGHTEDGLYFMAMEYLEGRTLHAAIKGDGSFEESRALHIAKQISRALREAHSMGVIHRDVKPANIYLIEHADETDFVKVLDFGLVKDVESDVELTQAGLFMGSPKYMSPEQIRGEKVDARTDIYSLGIVLFEMMTGKTPFDRGPSVNTLMAHVNDPIPSLASFGAAASPAMEELVMRCLAKDPAQRYSSMDELLAAMKHTSGSPMTQTMELPALSSTGPSGPLSAAAQVLGPRTSSGPVMPMTSLLPPAPVPTKSRAPIYAVAIALVAAAAGAGFFFRPHAATPTSTTTVAAPKTDAPKVEAPKTDPTPAVVSTPTPAPSVALHLTTDPNGATVRLKDKDGEQLCDATPCDVKLPPGDKVTLYFDRKGFAPSTRDVPLVAGDIAEKLKPVVFRAGPARAAGTAATTYKIDPYAAGLPAY